MPQGVLEVLLVSAKGLEDTDFLNAMDPYVVLTCRTHEQKSSVASGFPGKGSEPEWNENFVFTISEGSIELCLKIMDSDAGTADDLVGEATIPLDPVFDEGSLPPTAYNVVKDGEYKGSIRVGLEYKREESRGVDEGSYGGWKQSEESY
ncbi:16 kDa phloem protein 2 [Linum perenne]